LQQLSLVRGGEVCPLFLLVETMEHLRHFDSGQCIHFEAQCKR